MDSEHQTKRTPLDKSEPTHNPAIRLKEYKVEVNVIVIEKDGTLKIRNYQ